MSSSLTCRTKHSGIAQLIEHQILALKVGSLNLSTATNKKGGPIG